MLQNYLLWWFFSCLCGSAEYKGGEVVSEKLILSGDWWFLFALHATNVMFYMYFLLLVLIAGFILCQTVIHCYLSSTFRSAPPRWSSSYYTSVTSPSQLVPGMCHLHSSQALVYCKHQYYEAKLVCRIFSGCDWSYSLMRSHPGNRNRSSFIDKLKEGSTVIPRRESFKCSTIYSSIQSLNLLYHLLTVYVLQWRVRTMVHSKTRQDMRGLI